MMRTMMLAMGLLFCAFSQNASADESCISKIFTHQVTSQNFELVNLAIAASMNEDDYNRAKTTFSGQAVIYGIPVGASYEDFKNNIRNIRQSISVSDFETHMSSYVTSGIDDDGLQAYLGCVASQKGLAVLSGPNSSASSSIWLIFTPFPDSNTLAGHVVSTDNLRPDSERNLKTEVAKIKFGTVSRMIALFPINPKKPITIDIAVGDANERTAFVPAVKQPILTTEYVEDVKTYTAVAGFGNGGPRDCKTHDHQGPYCFKPTNPKAKFIVDSGQFVITAFSLAADHKMGPETPDQICATISADNESGCVSTSEISGHLAGRQIYFRDPDDQVPLFSIVPSRNRRSLSTR